MDKGAVCKTVVCGLSRFDSRPRSLRLGTPTGRAARLKPERLWVRIPLQANISEPERQARGVKCPSLGARARTKYVLVEQPGVLVSLSRRRSWVQIPPRTLPSARYANRQSGQAQTLECVGSNPTRATEKRSSTQTRQSGHLERVVIVCGFDSHLDHLTYGRQPKSSSASSNKSSVVGTC